MMDDGLLIEQVEKFKQLYDKKSNSFKYKLARENAWKSIGHILEIEAENCEQRWNVLRNKYAALKRQLSSKPSGSQSYTISWPYFDSMKFLDPYTLTRARRVSSLNQNSQSSMQSDQWLYEIISPESVEEDLDSSQNENDDESENIFSSLPNIMAQTPRGQKRKNEGKEGPSRKKNPSDTVAESMSMAFTSLSDSPGTYVATKNKSRQNIDSSDRAFAESIAADLSRVENFADKIYIKQQIYSLERI